MLHRRTGVILGSPHYIAPEQARLEVKVTIQADIYSLGATLFHMLSGEPPLYGSDALEVLERAMAGRVRSLLELRPSLPPGVTRTVDWMLSVAPGDRPAGPLGLLEALAVLKEGRDPTGGKEGWSGRLKRWLFGH